MRARATLVSLLGLVLALGVIAPAAQADFGITEFSGALNDTGGQPLRQAGAHPDLTTSIHFPVQSKQVESGGSVYEEFSMEENPKDIKVHLPAGLVGNPTVVPTCTQAQLRGNNYFADCPSDSQVGVVDIYFAVATPSAIPVPLYNMVPPRGTPAQFAFNFSQNRVFIDSHVVAAPGVPGGYTIESDSLNTTQAVAIAGVDVHLWGVPADTSHDPERIEAGGGSVYEGDGGVESTAAKLPLLDNPTSCPATASPFEAVANSWLKPGLEYHAGFSQDAEGIPFLFSGCESVPFEPSIQAQPTSREADSPSGLQVTVKIPQSENPDGLASADLKTTTLTLPEGMTINPASAGGLVTCSNQQIGLGEDAPATCPDASKIGSVELRTPLLDHSITGGVYLAKQGENKFGSLLAIYLTVEDPLSSTVIKLPGKIATSSTGRITTTFSETPQLPFETLSVDLFGGPRGPLRTPASCGTYTTQAEFTPWSGTAPVVSNDTFQINSGPGGGACPSGRFDPKLSVATTNPLGGHYSPFSLEFSREDATQALAGLDLTLPKGLLAKLAGVPYCSDAALAAIPTAEGTGAAQLADPPCPAASQIGTVSVGAGAGPIPLYVNTGRVYLAGPYKGAPLSLAVDTPALAGPFDLGNVVVRVALQVNPETTQVTAVSDPLPTILDGIPLDLRSFEVNLGREEFTLNPTNCDPTSVTASATSVTGATAALSDRFQVAGCSGLGFAPKLSLQLKGGTRRSAFPALRAELKAPPGEANIGRVSVGLPHSEFLEQSHIGTVCTRVQFAADSCPARSIYGYARAFTPLLSQPLEGPVYLRSSNHKLPDLVVALAGQIDVELDGRIDSVHGGIRTTFEAVPDAPVSKFTISLKGGKKSLLVNSTDICHGAHRAVVQMVGQNGKPYTSRPPLAAGCGKKKK